VEGGIVALEKAENPDEWALGEGEAHVEVLRRGAATTLCQVVKHFQERLVSQLPVLWKMSVENFCAGGQTTAPMTNDQDVVFCLQTLEVVCSQLSVNLHPHLETTLPRLCQLVSHPLSGIRHMSARCLAKLATVIASPTIMAVVNRILPMLESMENVHFRQGATETVFCVTEELKLDVVPYVVLFIVPVLGRLSDPDPAVRSLANKTFATHVKLVPLEQQQVQDENSKPQLSRELIERRAQDRQFVDELMNLQNVESYVLPVHINADFRPYQLDGIKWLAFLNKYNLHGVLCDDMGLGKTLQTIAMLASDHKKRVLRGATNLPSLVICPATLCAHWKYEILKFVEESDLTPLMYSGPATQREGARPGLRKAMREKASCVVLSSYEIARNDLEFFREFSWNYLILDEGHVIRNSKSKTTKAIKSLVANRRLILSGTPIQNSVLELWSLFDFLMPGFLGSERSFNGAFAKPILASRVHAKDPAMREKGALAVEALHRQVLPFILRRVKEQVLDDLPPKIIQDVYCDLSPLQTRLYEEYSRKQKLDEEESEEEEDSKESALRLDSEQKTNGKKKAHYFMALQHLRKVCNHPKLVSLEDFDSRIASSNPWPQANNLEDINHSGKLVALKELLLQCGIGDEDMAAEAAAAGGGEVTVAGQHRALVFFQLKSMMDIVIEDLLRPLMPSVSYLRLDGSVPANSRQDLVQKFNQDPSIDLMLLSTSVGGLGLNLTGADTVIFVEHDWNPMKDLQAMDRAHRIGQKKVVNVYRLIAKNTIEEKILGLQQFKLKTANSVISSENSAVQTMATDSVVDLFSLSETPSNSQAAAAAANRKHSKGGGVKAVLDNLPELWDQKQYEDEYDIANKTN